MSRTSLRRQIVVWVLGLLLCSCSCRAVPTAETPAIDPATERPTAAATTTVIPGLPPNLTPTQGARVPQSVKSLSLDGVPQLAGQRLGLGELQDVAVSADGEMLAIAWQLGIALYRLDTFEWVRNLGDPSDQAIRVAFSPDRSTLASANQEGDVALWDLARGEKTYILHSDVPYIEGLAFSPDGTRLAISVGSGPLRLWKVSPEAEGQTLEKRFAWPTLVFLPNGDALAEMMYDYDYDSSGPYNAALSPDGAMLAAGLHDGTVMLWDVATGKLAHIFERPVRGGDLCCLAFSPDGTLLAGGARYKDGVFVWDLARREHLYTLASNVQRVTDAFFAPHGETEALSSSLIIGSADGSVGLWDLETGARVRSLGGHTGWVTGVAFSPDGSTLASAAVNVLHLLDSTIALSNGAGDATLIQWDAETGRQVRALADSSVSAISADFSPDGRRLAFGTEDGAVVVWDVVAGKPLRTFDKHVDGFRHVAFSADGATLAAGAIGGSVALWDVNAGRLLHTLEGGLAALSPNGATLAVSAPGRIVELWDARSGELKRAARMPGSQGGGGALAFSPHGSLLAVAISGCLTLWDLVTDTLQVTVIGGSAASLAFSPDGRTLALGWKGDVILFDVATLEPVRRLVGGGGALDVAFSPDGTKVAAGARDHTVALWHLDEEAAR